jgi:hypothetical protein
VLTLACLFDTFLHVRLTATNVVKHNKCEHPKTISDSFFILKNCFNIEGDSMHFLSFMEHNFGRLQLKRDGTRWRTGGEVTGKLANGVGSQYPSHYLGTWCILHYYRWGAHLGCQQSTEVTPPRRFKWTRPFRRKTKSGFCACAITFQLASTNERWAGKSQYKLPELRCRKGDPTMLNMFLFFLVLSDVIK